MFSEITKDHKYFLYSHGKAEKRFFVLREHCGNLYCRDLLEDWMKN